MHSEEPIRSSYIFNYNWETVVKGFWVKYPCPEIDFIKWNKVIDLVVNPDNTVSVKRIVFTKKLKIIWCLTIEDIKLDFNNRVLEMRTNLLAKSQLFPMMKGKEICVYKMETSDTTLYEVPQQSVYQKKIVSESSFVTKYANQFNSLFKKGIEVINVRCSELVKRDF